MLHLLAAGAVWLALGARAAALAPAAGHELTPAAKIEMGPSADAELGPAEDFVEGEDLEQGEELDQGEELPWEVTPQHSHAVLKGLISADAAQNLRRGEMLEEQLEPGAPAQVLEEVPTHLPESRKRLPAGLEGLCASAVPIYDGPTMGWEDCRTKCIGHCRFWSYWSDSAQHRCKLTMDCPRRERDGRHSVSAHRRARDAAGEEEEHDQAAWGDETPPLDPEPQEPDPVPPETALTREAAPEANQTTCSPRGSARKFAVSPHAGWHNLGKTHSYVKCANTSLSKGYRNLVWNVGSRGKGRCYGFFSDMPEVLERSCEDTYCWLFGPACQDQNPQVETAQTGGSDSLEAESQAQTRSVRRLGQRAGQADSMDVTGDAKFEAELEGMAGLEETAKHKANDSADVEHHVSSGANDTLNEFKGAQAPAPEEKKGLIRRIKRFLEGATRRFRPARAEAGHKDRVKDSVEAERQATQEDNHTGVIADAEVNISVEKADATDAEANDPVEGELRAMNDSKEVETAEADDNVSIEGEVRKLMVSNDVQQ